MLQMGIRFVTNCVNAGTRNRAKLSRVSTQSGLIAVSLVCLLVLQGSGLSAQDNTSTPPKKKSSSAATTQKSGTTHKSSTTARKKSTTAQSSHRPRKKVTATRAHQMKRTFVASSDLRPMARQLVELRTPAAYAGVENYAHSHANTEAGALAWFAIGYAHYLDAQYPAAIAAMQKAQPYIGELKDYTSFFIGNSYVQSNSPDASFTYLRDFGTRFPDSLYAHDATIAYARALLATNRPAEAIHLLEEHRMPASAETEYFLGKAYVQTALGHTGAEILRRVYYNYPTS